MATEMRNNSIECLLITFHSCTFADIDEKSTGKIDRELSLMSNQLASASTTGIWYIDSGASSHMTGIRQYFLDLTETRLDLKVVPGDDSPVKVVGRGTVSFERDHGKSMKLRDVLYVHGLKKNLVSVSTIEDRGFWLVFRYGHVLIHPKGSNITSIVQIGVQSGKLYRLSFQLHHALAHDNSSDCGDLCEFWHRRMAQLHHPT